MLAFSMMLTIILQFQSRIQSAWIVCFCVCLVGLVFSKDWPRKLVLAFVALLSFYLGTYFTSVPKFVVTEKIIIGKGNSTLEAELVNETIKKVHYSAGFVVQNPEDCFYYAGDTALHSDMQLISRRYKLKCAFLPIGSNFTMDTQDAIEAARMLGTHTVIGMHYDTFGYIAINHEETHRAFQSAGINLHLMKIGETLTL
ncbi:MAG: hypothetical protein EBV15_03635 [Bacteroidetes bacterium]|nr:hypothetical protein [Bacteroidota bacterium]